MRGTSEGSYDSSVPSGEKGMGMFGIRIFVVSLGVMLAGVVSALAIEAPASSETMLPEGFVRETVFEGLSAPTAMSFAPDGRLLVAEQRGRLRFIGEGGASSVALDLSAVVDARGERGLLGIAADPAFARNGHVYAYFTRKAAGRLPVHNRIVRFTIRGDSVVPRSGRLVLRLDNLGRAKNHNGGAIHFGKDGKLYVAVGDNANRANAQSLRNLNGKMLRVNKNGTIPRGNPFFRKAVGKNRAIWAMGFRNPFSFAVHPRTGAIFVNDVGQKTWEEINRLRRGANYGWPRFEGPERNRRFAPPVFAYRHGDGPTTGCAITGGAFYAAQTSQFPDEYVGDYFFADFCSGWVRRYDPSSGRVSSFATGLSFPVDIKVGPEGNLYVLERGTGSVGRFAYTG